MWWNSGAQGAQLLLDGEVDVGATWNGRVHDPKLAGAPVDFHFDQAVFVSDAWGIPKGAPNMKESMEWWRWRCRHRRRPISPRPSPTGPRQGGPETSRREDPVLPADGRANFEKGVMLNTGYWAENGPRWPSASTNGCSALTAERPARPAVPPLCLT